MPIRKRPKTLERLSLESIGKVFKLTCEKSCDLLAPKHTVPLSPSPQSKPLSFPGHQPWTSRHLGLDLDSRLFHVIRRVQVAFLEEVPRKFHQFILRECLISLSDLYGSTCSTHREVEELELFHGRSDLEARRRRLMREEVQLAFLRFFAHQRAIREINLTPEFLSFRPLHWCIVAELCHWLANMESLEILCLGLWSCSQYGLLSRHHHREGWQLQFLPNLTRLQVCSVGQKFFEALGNYCPNLKELKVRSSKITDSATFWVSKCTQLECIELFDNLAVTPIGFAQLLRALTQLKSLGRCDVIGEAFSLLYSQKSIFRRSHPNSTPIPELLLLEEIDSDTKISSEALTHIVDHCKHLKSMRFKFLPSEQNHARSSDASGTLAMLNSLNLLRELSLTACDFYGHHLFHVLQARGKFLSKLELTDVDEMNWNAIQLIGDQAPHLNYLSIRCCHFQSLPSLESVMDGDNPLLAEWQASEQKPFQSLEGLDLVLTSWMHLVIVKAIVQFAHGLKYFIFKLFSDDFDEDLVRTMLSWSPFSKLQELEITSGANLSIHSVNLIIESCPNLNRLGRLRNWAQIQPHELQAIQREVKLRNVDLQFDVDRTA